MSTHVFRSTSAKAPILSATCLTRVGALFLRLSGSCVLASLLASCASTPSDTPNHIAAQRILPSPDGFVICADCEAFQPTVKRRDAPAKTPASKVEQSVPLAQSLSVNEQVIPVPLHSPEAKPKSIAILFDTNEARILPSEVLKIRSFLDSTPDNAELNITGCTDGTGRLAANVKLAERRAQSVKAFVTRSTHSRHVSISRAANCCPEAQDLTESERAKNRHVELSVVR